MSRFSLSQNLRELQDFIESNLVEDEFVDGFSIMTNFPRKNLSSLSPSISLNELFRNEKSQLLFVEKE